MIYIYIYMWIKLKLNRAYSGLQHKSDSDGPQKLGLGQQNDW